MPDDPELLSTNIVNDDVKFDLSAFDPVDDYLNRMVATLQRIKREEISAVIDVLFDAWKMRRQVFIFGNGGSAATAAHMANDLCKLAAVEGKKRFKAFCLTDNTPLMTAWSNDTAYESAFAEQLFNYIEPGDVVIAISTSGNSTNVLRALEVAGEHEATRIGFTGADGGQLKALVDHCVFIPDDYIGRQEDGHLILDHIIATTLRWMIAGEAE